MCQNVIPMYKNVQKCEPNVFKMYIFAHKNKGVQRTVQKVEYVHKCT